MSSTTQPLSNVRALIFDVFGTLVDWRSCITKHLQDHATSKQKAGTASVEQQTRFASMTHGDWGVFAQQWRDSYSKFTKGFDPERHAWKNVDQHFREALERLLQEWGLEGAYSDEELHDMTMGWHRLSSWPDVTEGMQELKKSYALGSLSNGNTALLKDLNEFGKLGFDTDKLFNAETFGAYKPHPSTYLGAVERLELKPHEVALVAAHMGDLASASQFGLKTIYVERAREEVWERPKLDDARVWVDLWVSNDEDGLLKVSQGLKEVSNHSL